VNRVAAVRSVPARRAVKVGKHRPSLNKDQWFVSVGRHHLYDVDGRETTRPTVFLDAVYGWVREIPGTFGHTPRGAISHYLVTPVVLGDVRRVVR
jgi:hypothetical protein